MVAKRSQSLIVNLMVVALSLILMLAGSALAAQADRRPIRHFPLRESQGKPPTADHRPSPILLTSSSHPLRVVSPPASHRPYPPPPPPPPTPQTLLASSLSTVRFAHLPSTDDGTKLYQQWCSTCHGDQGQGLTEEWRAQWPEGKQNCWQSKCHAANHPPDGFSFPKKVPALIGPDTLTRFRTAQELYVFNRSAMPYWAPNLLEDDEYRAITAFLIKANYSERGFPSSPSLSGDWTALSLHPETTVTEMHDDEISKVSQTPEVLPNAEVFSPAVEIQKSIPGASSTTHFLVWIAAIALGGGLVIWLISRFFPTTNKRG
jgi:hypothetical protein